MSEFTKETLEMAKAALGNPMGHEMLKGVTTANGLAYYDLQAPAKNLYPTYTPLRNSIPRVHRQNAGTATNWKQVTSLTGSGFDSMGWVPEGQRSGVMSISTTAKSASYMTIGEEDSYTFEAQNAARGFEDLGSTETMRCLQKTMRKEEISLLGGNGGGIALGTPTAPTLSASGSGATLPSATYSVIVVALTLEGWKNMSNGNPANNVPTTKTITGADGLTYTLNGGSSNKSSNTTQAVTLGQTLFASTPTIQGAVAYAWFVGTAGNETLQSVTNINSATFTVPLTGSRQAATAITADCSANSGLAYDGLLTTALNPSNLAYVNILGTGTAGTGTTLTASGRGTVVEIDNMLQAMATNYLVGPSRLLCSAQQLKDITAKVLSNSSGPLLRYDSPASAGAPYTITAGGTIDYYFNPFTPNGGAKVKVEWHPDVPPGTILAWCETLPPEYQSNEVPNVAEVITRQDYYRVDWPLRTRKREFSVYSEQVLAVYATFGMGVIGNVAAG